MREDTEDISDDVKTEAETVEVASEGEYATSPLSRKKPVTLQPDYAWPEPGIF